MKMNSTDADTSGESVGEKNSGHSSTSTLSSALSVSTTSKKQKNAAKKISLFEKRKEKKRQKKIEQNLIGKDDYYSKHTEFRTWLWEEKNLKFEELTASKAKDYFKKFVKKWNSKKLHKNYYRGIVSNWFEGGTPKSQSLWAMPKDVPVTPGSLCEEVLDVKYSRAATDSKLATFGKKEGAKALKQLQSMFSSNLSEEVSKEKEEKCEQKKSEDNKEKQKVSASSLPEVGHNKKLPVPPRRTCSLSNVNQLSKSDQENRMESASSIQVIFPYNKTKKRSNGKENDRNLTSPKKIPRADRSSGSVQSPDVFRSSSYLNSVHKWRASTRPKLARPKSADSAELIRHHQTTGDSEPQSSFKCATLRHSGYLSVYPSTCTFADF